MGEAREGRVVARELPSYSLSTNTLSNSHTHFGTFPSSLLLRLYFSFCFDSTRFPSILISPLFHFTPFYEGCASGQRPAASGIRCFRFYYMVMASLQPNLHSIHSDASPPSTLKSRTDFGADPDHHNSLRPIPWRSDTERRIYSSKLVEALRHVLRRSPSLPPKPGVGREIHEMADRVLAATAKGRTRWSRAILASRLGRWRFQRQHKKVKKVTRGLKKPEIRKERRRLPALQKKARVLGRLVPGCRKVSFPNLLEETTDYISALEMQVRAMTALTELLAGGVAPADRLEGPRP